MKIVILCGGQGIRLSNETSYIPKAMVKLGHRPLVWHVMKRYSLMGYNDFILALGERGDMIRDYFTRYQYYANDIQVQLPTNKINTLTHHQEDEWKITLVDTGDKAMTGARIYRCKQYIDDNEFMVTYADCLADVNIEKLLKFHHKKKRIATITGAIPPYRIGEFAVKNGLAVDFFNAEKSKKRVVSEFVNGGYMVFNKNLFKYLNSFNECRLETDVFSKLMNDKQLAIYPHYGFWQWLDTDRDLAHLNELVDKNKLYWLQDND